MRYKCLKLWVKFSQSELLLSVTPHSSQFSAQIETWTWTPTAKAKCEDTYLRSQMVPEMARQLSSCHFSFFAINGARATTTTITNEQTIMNSMSETTNKSKRPKLSSREQKRQARQALKSARSGRSSGLDALLNNEDGEEDNNNDDVYEQMTEEEYRQYVERKREREDFVVDDGTFLFH